MKLSEVSDILNADVLVGNEHMDRVVVGAGSADLMEDVLAAVAKDALLMTGVISEEVIRASKVIGVSAVVFVRGKRPTPSMLTLAKTYDLPVLLTRESLFVASGRLYMNGMRGLDGAW
ncbi:MAG: DRTGG domain-containing protein [Desulfobacterales bacterium]|jgi:predicted transcriptional regulator|nr:DRTGG domain-containing protein [Desulfobacterales bacterium]